MTIPIVTIAVEGDVDAVAIRRVLEEAGLEAGSIYGRRGKGQLDKSLSGYNNAARHAPWLVLRDLDHDAKCAPELLRRLLPEPSLQMCFRVAVRQIEAWLLADRVRIAELLQLPVDTIPAEPDALEDAKAALLHLARRSRNRRLRKELLPEEGIRAKVGTGYSGRMIEFAAGLWRPRIGALSSPSLAGCLRAVERWKQDRE
ncbi:MAG: hypothetical protein WAM82_07990 [Thermoanaerobaculia bacterium]